mgnify:CR=1 FL=1|jgi:hypothetical protein
MEWLLIIAPAAFLHGWFVGRTHGVKLGAAGMFDQLYDNGLPVAGKKNTKAIEVTLEEE